MNMLHGLVGLLSMMTSLLHATMYETYLQAHEQYAQGDFDAAYKQYITLPMHSFPFLYNFGCIQYQRGCYYDALLAFLKARACARGQDSARAQQACLRNCKKLGIVMPTIYSPYFAQGIAIVCTIPLLIVQLLWLLLISITVLYYMHARRRSMLISSFLLISMVCWFIMLYLYYYDTTVHSALVKNQETAVYTGPDTRYGIITRLPPYCMVIVNKKQDGWCRIKSGNYIGWVPTSMIDIVQ
jgi:hypothetical protein